METKILNSNELQIGDWVMYDPNVFIEDEYEPIKPIYPVKIKSGEDIDLVIEGCYTHIPLTAKILEKNGFEGTPTGDMYLHTKLWEQCLLKVELYLSEGSSVFVYRDKGPIDMYVNHILLHLNYVHELQRVLRCCGLWDLAENFKI